jgi:hypothetical protein
VKDKCFNAEHLLRTEYWMLELNPKASLALRVAAITHDVEKSFEKGRKSPKPEEKVPWDDQVYCLWHGERSAEFTIKQLKIWKVKDKILLNKIIHLIKFHELGGDEESELLKDADSLSFLEVTILPFIAWARRNKYTKESVKEKIEYMFNRISSPKAKKLVLPFYNKAIGELEKI